MKKKGRLGNCESLFETLLDTEKEPTKLSDKIQKLMIDDNELIEHIRKTTHFHMSLKKAKWK